MNPSDLTEEERYVFDERLGMCGCTAGQKPTPEQLASAWAAVREFQKPVDKRLVSGVKSEYAT